MDKTKKIILVLLGLIVFVFGIFKMANVYAKIKDEVFTSDGTLAEWLENIDNRKEFINVATNELQGQVIGVENVSVDATKGSTISKITAYCMDPHTLAKTKSNAKYRMLSIIDVSPKEQPKNVLIDSRANDKSANKVKVLTKKNAKESVKAGYRMAYYINQLQYHSKDWQHLAKTVGGKKISSDTVIKNAIKHCVYIIVQNNKKSFNKNYHWDALGKGEGDKGWEEPAIAKKAKEYANKILKNETGTFKEIDIVGSDTVGASETAVPIYQYNADGTKTIVGYDYYTMIGPMKATWKGGTLKRKFTINDEEKSYAICKSADYKNTMTAGKWAENQSGYDFYIRYHGRLNAGDKVKFKVTQTGNEIETIRARIGLLSNKAENYDQNEITQNLGIFAALQSEISTSKPTPVTWKVNPSNKLKVIKRGKNGEALNGVKFKLYNSAGQEVGEKITEGNGEAIFENLATDTYYAKEIYIDPNISGTYSAYAQGQPESDSVEVSGDDDEEIEFCEMDNEQYTSLKINKQAKYQNRNVAGVKFKLQYKENGTWRWVDNYTYGTPSTINLTDNEAEADEYTTGADGNISFANIPVGYYRVTETYVPEPLTRIPQTKQSDGTYKLWTDFTSEECYCEPISDNDCEPNGMPKNYKGIIKCENPEVFKISGYVFTPTKATTKSEQGIGGRESNYKSSDYVVKSATVTLLKKDEEDGEFKPYEGKEEDGEKPTNPTQLTAENGYYEYTVVKTNDDDNESIKPFAVKFTYDSIDFIGMSPNYKDSTAKEEIYSALKEGATSKAEEVDDWNIRKRYTEIYGDPTPEKEFGDGDEFKGKAKYKKERDKDEEETTELTYKWNEVTKDVSGDNIKNPGTTGISESICQRNQTGYTQNDTYISINKEGKDIDKDNKIESFFYLDGTEIYGEERYNTIEDYSEKTADGRLSRVNQINLGLVTREQPDLSVTNSLVNVNAEINGYTNIYKTASPNLSKNDEALNVGVTYVTEGNLSVFEVYPSDAKTIADANNSRIQDQLDRKLKLYVTYKIELVNNSNSLYSKVNELALFYDENYSLITVSKEKNEYDGKANEKLSDNYELEVKETSTRRTVGHKEGKSSYNEAYIDTSEIGKGYIMPAEDKEASGGKTFEEIYVTYQVKDREIEKMLSEDRYVPQFRHIAEINSYTTYEKDWENKKSTDKVLYSGIDKNSAPGNVPEKMDNEKLKDTELDLRGIPLRNELMRKRAANISKFDNDTGYAEEFTINFKDKERSLEGTVFRDNDSGYHIGQERTSDGILNENEAEIKNVKVSLVEADLDDKGQIKIDDEGKVIERTNSLLSKKDCQNKYTGEQENGNNYKIEGFIPGNFVLKYEYNDQAKYSTIDGREISINALDYKSAVVSKKGLQDYDVSTRNEAKWYTTDNPTADNKKEGVTRYSEVFDNWITRKTIDSYSNDMTHETTEQSYNIGATMDSYTPVFAVYVELNTLSEKNEYLPQYYNIINMDFGITERAEQKMSIEKRISNIKITLPNGQVLLDGDPRNNKKMSGLKYLAPTKDTNGTVNVELDSELIHGSTLELTHEITVHNESELDYYKEEYYKFGNQDENKLVTITPIVYDYVDNNLTFDKANPELNGNWTVIEKDKFVINSATEGEVLVSADALKNIQNKNTIVQYTGEQFNNTKPGENYTEHLTLTRLLSNSSSDDDDLTYNNNIEIDKGTKSGGRRILTQIAVYMAGNKGGIGASSEETTITPPTGEDRDYTIYIVIGTLSLLILATGIIIIKKKVLK